MTLVELDRHCVGAARGLSLVAILVMLALATLTVLDVLLRLLFASGIPGLYEIAELALAVAIAACFPVAIAQRASLQIDILRGVFGSTWVRRLEAVGGLILLVFLTLLAWRLADHALAMQRQAAVTTILAVATAPFWWAVAIVVAACVPLQTVALVADLTRNRAAPAEDDGSDRKPAAPGRWRLVLVWALVATAVASLVLLAVPTGSRPLVAIGAFLAMLAAALLLVPLAAALGLAGLLGAIDFVGVQPALHVVGSGGADMLARLDLAAIPLFVLMGGFAAAAGMSTDLYRLAHLLLGGRRGGLAFATIGGCAAFGAVTGSSLATAVTMGRIAIPEMQRHRYSMALSTGCVAAGGTLGMLIPPSTIMVIYGVLTQTSIGSLFIAAIIPAAISVALYFCAITAYIRLVPGAAPSAGRTGTRREIIAALLPCWAVALLFLLVVGGLYGGVYTATEAAGVGAGAAFLIAWARGGLGGGKFWHVLGEAAGTTAMIYLIVLGAAVFSFLIGLTQVPDDIVRAIQAADLAPLAVIALVLLMYLGLGAVLDPFAMLLVTIPVVIPLVSSLGYDLVWWGIVTVVVVELGLMSPPIGMNVFVIKSVVPEAPIGTIFRGVTAFVLVDLVKLALLVLLPILVTWLPSTAG